jgi:hypothetical protein
MRTTLRPYPAPDFACKGPVCPRSGAVFGPLHSPERFRGPTLNRPGRQRSPWVFLDATPSSIQARFHRASAATAGGRRGSRASLRPSVGAAETSNLMLTSPGLRRCCSTSSGMRPPGVGESARAERSSSPPTKVAVISCANAAATCGEADGTEPTAWIPPRFGSAAATLGRSLEGRPGRLIDAQRASDPGLLAPIRPCVVAEVLTNITKHARAQCAAVTARASSTKRSVSRRATTAAAGRIGRPAGSAGRPAPGRQPGRRRHARHRRHPPPGVGPPGAVR